MVDKYLEKVRLDKWLWAARFFKTRALAKAAIEGGKVQVEGQRAKPSKDIAVGMTLTVRQGWDEKTVVVDNLSEQRRGASEAATLYTETEASVEQRKQRAEERRAANLSRLSPGHRPSKKERRQIHRFKEQNH
jgi:ribosome-associated heat shock protein Hsp15